MGPRVKRTEKAESKEGWDCVRGRCLDTFLRRSARAYSVFFIHFPSAYMYACVRVGTEWDREAGFIKRDQAQLDK